MFRYLPHLVQLGISDEARQDLIQRCWTPEPSPNSMWVPSQPGHTVAAVAGSQSRRENERHEAREACAPTVVISRH